MTPPPRRTPLLRSFGYAFSGVGELLRTQRNARIHVGITLAVLLAGWWLGITRSEWLVVVLLIGAVLCAEALNSAIETVVDLASPQLHPLAGRAKDLAAGGVLLLAIAAAVAGAIIFVPYLWALVF